MGIIENFGGNKLRKLDLSVSGRQDLADGPYVYYYYNSSTDDVFTISDLKSFSVFVLSTGEGVTVSYSGIKHKELDVFNVVQVENVSVEIASTKGAIFLIAGTYQPVDGCQPSVIIQSEEEMYKVVKPWGWEIWINGEYHPNYALKKIKINKETKTSLQYHNFKQETNVIYEGEAILHYKKDIEILNDEVKEENIGKANLTAVTSIDVSPETIHRIESLTDVLLYEVSTPHLDDVIRLQDDARRVDGKIQGEHANNG